MDLFQLKVFCSLGNSLNYRKTADELHITQPAVSYHIKALEAELGISLLKRSRHRTELTAAGTEFLHHAETMCEQERFARERMAHLSAGKGGRLTVAGIQTYLQRICETEAAVLSESPDIQIDTFIMDGPDLLHSYRFSEYDIYIGAENMIEDNPAYTAEVICTDDMELYYPVKLKGEVEGRDLMSLKEIPFISIVEKNHLLFSRIRKLMDDKNYSPLLINHSTTIESILSLVDAGCGITILPAGSNTNRKFGDILTMPIDHEDSQVTMTVAWRTDANQALIRRFIDMMHAQTAAE